MAVEKQLFEIAEKQYRDQFIEVLANRQKLMGTTEEEHGVIGDAFKWPIIGNVEMEERTAVRTEPPPSEIKFDQITTVFNEFSLNVPLDKSEEVLLKPNIMAKYSKRHAEAVGRRLDQYKLNALATATQEIAVGTTNLTLAKLLDLLERFDNYNVPDEDRYIAVAPNQISALLKDPKVTSSDYVTIKALLRGQLDTYLGFKFIKLGISNKVAKLPKTDDNRTCFAWHKDSIGIAFNMEPQTWMKESPTGFNYYTLSRVKAGASLLMKREGTAEIDGVVKIVCNETK